MTDDITESKIRTLLTTICGSEKRHSNIIRDSVKEAFKVSPHDPMDAFVTSVTRKMANNTNENLIINPVVLRALLENDYDKGFPKMQRAFLRKPKTERMETFPVLTKSGQVMFLVISHYAFRASEIATDIWEWLNPDATPDEKYRSNCVTGTIKVSENLSKMGVEYSDRDIIDCLNLMRPNMAFFLRSLFLYHRNIEPKPFIEKIEKEGFTVTGILDEELSEEENAEYDFLKRLQGIIIAKSPDAMAESAPYLDFIMDMSRHIAIPTGELTDTGQLQ